MIASNSDAVVEDIDDVRANLPKLADFIGQEKITADIKNRIELALRINKNLPNLLFSAAHEMGKIFLAQTIASEMKVNIKILSRYDASKMKEGDVASVVTNLSEGDILVIPEIEELNHQDLWMDIIENCMLDITLGRGPGARNIRMELPKFSIIATTSKPWKIDERLRRWFVIYEFAPYDDKNIAELLMEFARRENFALNIDAAKEMAPYCKSIPGNASVIIKKILPYVNTLSESKEIKIVHLPKILSLLGFGELYPKSLSLAEKFSHMSGQEFEVWVANYFRNHAYTVEITKGSGDHGIDLMLYKSNVFVGIVQCKCWRDPVGEPIIRDFYGAMMSSKAPEGYIFATTSFTPQAVLFAQDKPIRLYGLDELVNL